MSGPSERDEIAAVLAGHQRKHDWRGSCLCGNWPPLDHSMSWPDHLADALTDLLAERDRRTAATAWDDGFKAGQGSMLVSAGGETRTNPHREVRENGCGVCLSCDPPQRWASRMYVCATCGNKRCPAAGDCLAWECSGSNEPGQKPVPRAEQ